MSQWNPMFLEPDPVNAMDRWGNSVVFADPEPGQRHAGWAMSWIEEDIYQGKFFQSIFYLDRCSWQGCDRFTYRKLIPLCRDHAVRVWSLVDRLESRGVHLIARQDFLDNVRKKEDTARLKGMLPGWVYYLRIGGLIKIGFTGDMDSRMKQYPPNAELLGFHPGTRDVERRMHEKFSLHRAAGREWFHPDDPVLSHVREVQKAQEGADDEYMLPLTPI